MRPIDADETRKKMLNSLEEIFENVEMTAKTIHQKTLIRTIIHHIDDAQTIEAAPIKHGHWIVADDGVTRCSICYGASDYERSFCGDCGAKMDGGEAK